MALLPIISGLVFIGIPALAYLLAYRGVRFDEKPVSIQRSDTGFRREYFVAAVLMLVGVIEASVFTELAEQSIAFYCPESDQGCATLYKLWSSEHLNWQDGNGINALVGWLAAGGLQSLYIFATFFSILVVTFDYLYFVVAMARNVRPLDVLMIFVLGYFQVWMAHTTDSSAAWWLSVSLFMGAAFFAYLSSAFLSKEGLADPGFETPESYRRHLNRRKWVPIGGLIVAVPMVFVAEGNASLETWGIYASLMHAAAALLLCLFGTLLIWSRWARLRRFENSAKTLGI